MINFSSKNINLKHTNTQVFFFFFMIYAFLFYQFPYKLSLPGNEDGWYNLAMFESFIVFAKSLFSDDVTYFGSSMYPLNSAYLYSEMSVLNWIIYASIRVFFVDKIIAWYLFLVIVFSLNSWSFFLFSKSLGISVFASVIAGIMISCNNYMFCSLDQFNVYSLYPAFFSLYFFSKYLKDKLSINVFLGALFFVLQTYVSAYYFLFLSIILCCLFVKIYFVNKVSFSLKDMGIFLCVTIMLILPFLYLLTTFHLRDGLQNPMGSYEIISQLSFKFKNLFSFHPHNLLYGDGIPKNLMQMMKSQSLGFALPVFSLFIIYYTRNYFTAILLLVVVFISMGPIIIQYHHYTLYSPLYLFLELFDMNYILRMPLRAFVMATPLFILVSIKFLDGKRLNSKVNPKVFLIIFSFLFLIENVPYKLQTYPSHKFINVPDNVNNALKDVQKDDVVLFIPSTLFTVSDMSPLGLDEYNRDYIYMYWQVLYQINILNGLNGYVAESRIRLNDALKSGDCELIRKILEEFSVTKVFYVEMMRLEEDDINLDCFSNFNGFKNI